MCLKGSNKIFEILNFIRSHIEVFSPFRILALFTINYAAFIYYEINSIYYQPEIISAVLIALVGYCIIICLAVKRWHIKLSYIVICMLAIIIGYMRMESINNSCEMYANYLNAILIAIGEVSSRPKILEIAKNKQIKVKVNLNNIMLDKKTANKYVISVDNSIYAYLPLHYKKYEIGDSIILHGKILPIKESYDYASFNQKSKLINNNIIGNMYDAEVLSITKNKNFFLMKMFQKLRNEAHKLISENIKDPEGYVFESLLFGVENRTHEEIHNIFVKTGVAHILATSGTHVSIILAGIIILTKICSINKNIRWVFAISVIGIYVGIVGIKPPLVRAAIVGAISLYGISKGHRYFALQALTLTFLLSVLYQPYIIADISFQLSYGASYGILLFYKRLYQHLRWIYSPIRALMVISVSAQIIDLPIQQYYFHSISMVSLISNVLITPILEMIILVGVIIVTLSSAILGFGISNSIILGVISIFYKLIYYVLHLIIIILKELSNFRYANISVKAMGLPILILYVLGVCIFLLGINYLINKRLMSILLFIIIFLMVLTNKYEERKVNVYVFKEGINEIVCVTHYNKGIFFITRQELYKKQNNQTNKNRLISKLQEKSKAYGIESASVIYLNQYIIDSKKVFILSDELKLLPIKTTDISSYVYRQLGIVANLIKEKNNKYSLSMKYMNEEIDIIYGQNIEKTIKLKVDYHYTFITNVDLTEYMMNQHGVKYIAFYNSKLDDFFAGCEEIFIIGKQKIPKISI